MSDRALRASDGSRSRLLTGLLCELNAEQRRVVLAPPGPLLVLAGAGSGKTLTLAARIAYAIASGRVAPEHVLAITFTSRAARELRERIAHLAGRDAAARLECGTHHAVCNRQLRRHAARIERTSRFSIYEPSEIAQVLRRVIAERAIEELSPEGAAAAIARAKDGLLDAQTLRTRLNTPVAARVATVWEALEEELRRSDALDFDDLLVRSVRLMRSDPGVLAEARRRWRFVLVDEFQDTNRPQWAWLELVCAHHNLTAMGDDDQAIYSWRGGAVDNILDIDRRLAGTRVRKLERNYRSSRAIVCAASRLIEVNPGRRPKRMWTANPPGRTVEVRPFLDDGAEARAVADWCTTRLAQGRPAEALAVLFRARRLAGPLAEALLAAGIPHRVLGDRSFLAYAEVRDALAHLRLVANPRDRRAFERAAGTLPGVGPKAIERVLRQAEEERRSPLELSAGAERVAVATVRARAELARWGRALQSASQTVGQSSLSAVVGAVIRDSGLPARLSASGAEADRVRLGRLRRLVELARDHERREPRDELADFLAGLALAAGEEDDNELPGGRVTLATVHAAKGGEWQAVWVCGLEEGTLPGHRALAADELPEERRVAYVAITRAREELVVSHADRRGHRWNLRPSQFLGEALSHSGAGA